MNSGLAMYILHVHVAIQVNVQVYFGILWGTLGYRPFCCGQSVFGEWFPFMVVGSTIFSQNRAVFPPFNSKRLNANLNDDDAKETMENHDIYIYILFIYLCFAINYHVYPGNLLETWETIGNPNWFCSDRPEVEQPNTHLAHRLPSVVRGDPGILICLRLHLVGPGGGYDMFLFICNCH